MKPTIFLLGPSDIEGQSLTDAKQTSDGKILGEANWSGIVLLQPMIDEDASLKKHSHFFLMGLQELRFSGTGEFNLFNLIGDADASPTMLRKAQEIEYSRQPARSFNRPSDVHKTARANLPKTLQGISSCYVPRVEKLKPETQSDLQSACEEFGHWPLIIRAAGYHRGEKMVLLRNPDELPPLNANDWIQQDIFLIEFVDTRDSTELYHKARVIVVDGKVIPRHCIFSNSPFIHAGNRSELMDNNHKLREREESFLDMLKEKSESDYKALFSSIHQRLGLDLFGIDFSLTDNGIVIYEANPCMNFLYQDFGDRNQYRYLETYIKACKRAVKRMLMNG